MPNSNYQAGRRMEWARKKAWEATGYTVLRTAGSRGDFDLVAYRPDHPTTFIQCKICKDEKDAARRLRAFREHPPTLVSTFYHQCLECKWRGSSRIESVTV